MDTQQIITWPYRLRRGHSTTPEHGACVNDAVNWLAHGEHGDHPPCMCPVLANYNIVGNDAMPNDIRQRFLPRIHLMAGSYDPPAEARRLRILVLGAVRVFAPLALDAIGLTAHASELRGLPDDVSFAAARLPALCADSAGYDALGSL